MLKVNHYQQLTKVLPTKLTIRPKEVKVLIPENVDLLYFSIQEPIWKARPEESNDGGLFNYGEPIMITK